MVVPAFHYALGDMSPYYLFAGWIYDLPYSCAAKRWPFAGFFRIAIDVLQVTGRHCHHHRYLLPFTQPPPPPPHLLHSSTLREQGAVDRLAEVAKTLGSHQTAELRECVKHLERRGRRHV